MKLAPKSGLPRKTKSTASTPHLSQFGGDSGKVRTKGRRKSLPKKDILPLVDKRPSLAAIKALKAVLPRSESKTGSMHAGEDGEMEKILGEVSQIEVSLAPQAISAPLATVKQGRTSPVEKRLIKHKRSEALPKVLRIASNSPSHKSPSAMRPVRTPDFGSEKSLRKKSLQMLQSPSELLDLSTASTPFPSRLKPLPGGSLESSSGQRHSSIRGKAAFDLTKNPAKRGIRRFEKVQTDTRDYLEKLEEVMMQVRTNHGKLIVG